MPKTLTETRRRRHRALLRHGLLAAALALGACNKAADADGKDLAASERTRFLAEAHKILPQAFKPSDTGEEPPDEAKIANFMMENAGALLRAPDDALSVVVEDRLKILKALQAKDVVACGHAAVTWEIDPKDSPAVYRMFTDMNIDSLKATRVGLQAPIDRGPRSPADRAAFTAAVGKRGLPANIQALILRPSSLYKALPSDQCDAGVALYETLMALPPDVRVRTFIQVASTSYAPRGGGPQAATGQ